MKLLIKGGRIIDPINGLDQGADILVAAGTIEQVAAGIKSTGDVQIIDAAGCVVAPGLIDMHVHLRDPGFEASEDIESGTLAAISGGITTVAAMPNTEPVVDSGALVRAVLAKASEKGHCRVLQIGSITKGELGEELAEMGDMFEAGIVAVSDDGRPVTNPAVMRSAMQYARALGIPVISHCEETALSAGGAMHEGRISTVLGLKGIPAAAEEIMVARDIILAENTGAQLHLAHVSTVGSVRLVREAKARGVAVTCEVTPHHFTLSDASVRGYDTNTKVNPPLRTPADIEALIEGLEDGTIDAVASDHAPHTVESKSVEYDLAPFGISGLETVVPLVSTNLVLAGHLTWQEAISKLTVAPAKILNLSPAGIRVGAPADLTVIDPEREQKVDVGEFKSKGKNSPFDGISLKGWPVATINGEKLVAAGG